MSELGTNRQDEEHLRLLTIFHYVCAGMMALFACIPLVHLAIGLALWLAPHSFGSGNGQPPRFVGMIFVVVASILIITGWTMAVLVAWSGRNLSRRKRYTFCLVMAGILCLFMPFGTALGIFTIIVLQRPSVKSLFAMPTPS